MELLNHRIRQLETGILDAIGQTPLVQLSHYLPEFQGQLWAKLELLNPGGSMKDRPAWNMLKEAQAAGTVTQETVVIESSSGNMGIGLAQACCYYGLRFICVVDPRAQKQNLRIMEAYGAEIHCVEHPDPIHDDYLTARLNYVKELVKQRPNAFWPNQYANLHNPAAHEQGTVREIYEALQGRLDYLFVPTSSTGTARGCQSFLQKRPGMAQVIAVDAEGSVLFNGSPGPRKVSGLGAGQIPPLSRGQTFDAVCRVSDLDCVVGCRRLVQTEAILAGGSSGGVMEAIRRMAPSIPNGSVCAAILPDRGSRYLDTIYNDEWVEQELQCNPYELQLRVEDASGSLHETVGCP